MSDRLKAIVTSGLAFGALAIPGFTALVTALGGDAEIMQAVVGGYAVYHVIRLAVDYFHAKVAGAVLLALLIPVGASAQQRASISLDSALAPDSVDPGVTLTAPIHSDVVSLYAHIGRDSDEHGVVHQTTQAGLRFHAPTVWNRVQPYVALGFEHLASGTLDISDVLSLKVQPGVRVYVREYWGVGFRTPPIRVSTKGNPYDRQTRVLVSVFGEF